MKKFIQYFIFLSLCLQFGCNIKKSADEIHFALSADYPPFEYRVSGELTGFEIDLAKHIAHELDKKPIFHDMSLSAVLPSLQNGSVDAAISTITVTDERSIKFDFSQPYFYEEMFIVFNDLNPIRDEDALQGKKIACQLGTTMEIWLKQNIKFAQITAMDNNNQAIEALKSRLVDAVVMDKFQAKAFCEKNKALECVSLVKSDKGYAIAFRKKSDLRTSVDQTLQKLIANGVFSDLCKKWKIQ